MCCEMVVGVRVVGWCWWWCFLNFGGGCVGCWLGMG